MLFSALLKMIKNRALAILLIISGILVLLGTFSVLSSASPSTNSKISSDVYQKAQQNGTAQVFIEFKNNNLNGKSVSSLSQIDSITGNFGNVVSANVGISELNSLQNNPNVERVSLVTFKHVFLQDSVPLINGTKTWPLQQNSMNLTGAGQTVCIIDTGVDYTHPDLGGCYGNNNASSPCKVIGGYNFIANNSNPMDDHGHGTHVAGIIGANGTIKGVAPGVKIVALKVCDSSGSCADNDIFSAIDWCVGNSSAFNIRVISISLGGELNYTSYCDNNPSENSNFFTPHINAAIAKNISVVIAAGNSGNYTAVSSPGCIQNVTVVSSSTKSDSISSFSNRWQLDNLFAPGEAINSTWPGGYAILSGTSMATPHVSGAIAIINEYLKLSNQTKTPKQIEYVLNSTGKKINDSLSGTTYSRIDIYSSIILSDNQPPVVSLISPINNNISSYFNQTFICNATDLSLHNITFYLWNSTSGVYNQTFSITNGSSNQFQINLTNLGVDNYHWNCLYTDENDNSAFAISNFTLPIQGPFVTLNSPVNSSPATINETFNCSAISSFQLKNVTFFLWNSTGNEKSISANITGTSNSTSINYTFTHEDNYKWNCLFTNNASNQSFATQNSTLTYDITPPNVTLGDLPVDNTTSSVSNTFYYNVSDNLNIANCSLFINNNLNLTNSSVNKSVTNTFIQTFTPNPGTYNYYISCSDFGSNVANSSTESFVIVAPSTGGGGSGGSSGSSSGSGGGASLPIIPQVNPITVGYSKKIGTGQRINFTALNGEKHTLTLDSIQNNSATITIQSTPQNLTLKINESVKLSLSSPNIYDILVTLNSIEGNNVNITLKAISEPIGSTKHIVENSTNSTVNTTLSKVKSNNYPVILIALIVVIFLVIFSLKARKVRKHHKLIHHHRSSK